MSYTAPSLIELRNLALLLDREYKKSNSQRFSFITLLDTVINATTSSPEHIAKRIIIGAMIYELEHLKGECRLTFTPGSTLYTQMMQALKITKENPLGDDERLIYTHAFYKYVNNAFSDSTMQAMNQKIKANKRVDLDWKSKDALLNDIQTQVKAIRKRDASRIDQLIHARPALETLRREIGILAANYHKMANAQQSSWALFGRDVKRDELTNFINLVDRSCRMLYEGVKYDELPEPMRRKMINDESQTRRGLLIFVALYIESNYHALSPQGGWFTSGSNLFKDILQLLNVDSLDGITASEKSDCLQALSSQLKNVRSNRAEWDAFIKKIECENIKPLKTDKELYIAEIAAYQRSQEQQKYELHGRAGVASTAIGCAAQSTTTYALDAGAGSYFAKGVVGAIAMSVGGMPAVTVYSSGMVAMAALRSLFGDQLVSAATAGIYAWLLDKLGASIGTAATEGIFNLAYETANDGILDLRMKLEPEDDKLFCDWVNTLLELTDDTVSVNEKENIRSVFALKEKCELLPLHHSTHTSTIQRRR